jgi:hypothetical protein
MIMPTSSKSVIVNNSTSGGTWIISCTRARNEHIAQIGGAVGAVAQLPTVGYGADGSAPSYDRADNSIRRQCSTRRERVRTAARLPV